MLSKFKPETEFYTAEGCYIVETHNRAEDESCSIVRACARTSRSGRDNENSCTTRHQ
jgi:hypothetical protein